jgi:hypothetical protein
MPTLWGLGSFSLVNLNFFLQNNVRNQTVSQHFKPLVCSWVIKRLA